MVFLSIKMDILIELQGGGGGRTATCCSFCPLQKKSKGNPYLKILNFSQLYVSDAPMKKKSKTLVLPLLRGLLFVVDIFAHALITVLKDANCEIYSSEINK